MVDSSVEGGSGMADVWEWLEDGIAAVREGGGVWWLLVDVCQVSLVEDIERCLWEELGTISIPSQKEL